MMRTLTKEEYQEIEDRVVKLHSSSDLEDRIVGILTDTSIGSLGLHEACARYKAKALAQLFEVWEVTTSSSSSSSSSSP